MGTPLLLTNRHLLARYLLMSVVITGFVLSLLGMPLFLDHVAAQPQLPPFFINSIEVIEADEGTVNAIFLISRSGPLDDASTVDYATIDGTATVAGNDYVPVSGTLTFAPQETAQKIVVPVVGDTIDEGISEQFMVILSNPTSAVIHQGEGIGRIIDNDSAAIVVDGPSAADRARAQAPLCSLMGGGTNPIVRAVVPDNTITDGRVFCRIIAQDSLFVTGAAEVGNPDVLALGVIHAVDVFGLLQGGIAQPQFNYPVKACLLGTGRLFYLDATTYPRALSELLTTSEFEYTCGWIGNAGTVVLVP